jgi:hypothetical protein
MCHLDPTKMSKAEVSLRLAISFAEHPDATGGISVAIDGAQVQVGQRTIFPLIAFMNEHGWETPKDNEWKGRYLKQNCVPIEIHSIPGKGDVVARLRGNTYRIEAKKGPLIRSRSSQEYPLIREALGQLMTVEEITDNDILGIAVPDSSKFRQLAEKWRNAPLIRRFQIKILLVDRANKISGL